jgi:hypothetical protein
MVTMTTWPGQNNEEDDAGIVQRQCGRQIMRNNVAVCTMEIEYNACAQMIARTE